MTEKAENIEEAIHQLSHVAKYFPKAVKDCGATFTDLKNVENAIAVMHSPWTFACHVGKDILVNGVDIYKQIQDMIEGWKAEKYFEFGKHLGEALELIFIGKKNLMFMEGI